MELLSRKRVIIGGIVSCFLATTGVVLATIPSPNGVIYTCFTKSTGTLRVIDAAVTGCKQGESQLTLNQTGPQGPVGPQGPAGADGAVGPAGGIGPAGPDGVSGYQTVERSITLIGSNSAGSGLATFLYCPDGTKPVGGGTYVAGGFSDVPFAVQVSGPIHPGDSITGGQTATKDGWLLGLLMTGPTTTATQDVKFRVACVTAL